MRVTKSREWLDRFLAGHVPTDQELKQLVVDCAKEDQHLDYKSGLTDSKDLPAVLREYVAAFANSDGGTLVVGYHQKKRVFDGVTPPGGAALTEWATRSVYDLAAFLSPQPRFVEAHADGKPVLLIAVARAPRLVPVVEKGKLVYHLRIGESNFAAPPFLLSDLVLGRRNHPVLTASIKERQFRGGREDIGSLDVHGRQVSLLLMLENASLVTAEDVRCGLISWVGVSTHWPPEAVAPSLRVHLEVRPPFRDEHTIPFNPVCSHIRRDPEGSVPLKLHALDQIQFRLPIFLVPVFPDHSSAGTPGTVIEKLGDIEGQRQEIERKRLQLRGAIQLNAAGYVLARDAEPWWFQLTMRYDHNNGLRACDLASVTTPRPEVSIDFYDPQD